MIADWDLACSTERGNVCLIGASATTHALMDELRPHLRQPVITVGCSDSLEVPAAGDPVGTVILFDVEGLALADQHSLLAWLAQPTLLPRVISTAQESILAMIGAGRFLGELYYRLNVICLDAREAERLDEECEVPSAHEQRIEQTARATARSSHRLLVMRRRDLAATPPPHE